MAKSSTANFTVRENGLEMTDLWGKVSLTREEVAKLEDMLKGRDFRGMTINGYLSQLLRGTLYAVLED